MYIRIVAQRYPINVFIIRNVTRSITIFTDRIVKIKLYTISMAGPLDISVRYAINFRRCICRKYRPPPKRQ